MWCSGRTLPPAAERERINTPYENVSLHRRFYNFWDRVFVWSFCRCLNGWMRRGRGLWPPGIPIFKWVVSPLWRYTVVWELGIDRQLSATGKAFVLKWRVVWLIFLLPVDSHLWRGKSDRTYLHHLHCRQLFAWWAELLSRPCDSHLTYIVLSWAYSP